MLEEEEVDLVVIGAGWHGLAAAKTYLEVNPSERVMIFEEESTVGGVWAKHRLYPGLKSNNLLGTYEFSDFAMDSGTYGLQAGRPLPAEAIHQYLTNYAEPFIKRIRFSTKVESAEHKPGGGWLITFHSIASGTGSTSCIFTSKLVVATGLTSDPFLPVFTGRESFAPPLFHPKELKTYESTIQTAKSVCVYGGTKSAWDAVYTYASRGVQVNWIIRESGHGPTWMAPPFVTPLKKWLEKLTQTRFLTWLSPCIWGDADGYSAIRSFLHGTTVGRFIVDRFWAILAGDVISLNKYDSHPETAKLKPWSNPFFIASSLSILNYDTNFFDLVKDGKARVHIADITSLDTNTIHLSNGEILQTDALICCTGWKHVPPLKFLPENLDLGLPHRQRLSEPTDLIGRADKEILDKFPRLRDQPKPNPKYKSLQDFEKTAEHEHESYKLYRFMIPPEFIDSRDIAFAGSLLTIATSLNAQVQALWITAYFNGKVSIPSDVKYVSVLHSRFGKWRYPAGFGKIHPDFVFDSLPYIDMLLTDLALKCHRKNGVMAEIFSPYGPEDYKGLVKEWMVKDSGTKLHIE